VGGGGWLESKLSDQLWLSFSLALAKPNNIIDLFCDHAILFSLFLPNLEPLHSWRPPPSPHIQNINIGS
jgi:hypothetical protein